MSAKSDAAAFVSGHLLGGMSMKAPAGFTTKTINGKSQPVSAAEAWAHSSTDQTDGATVKTFVTALAEEFHKRGDPGRAAAALQLAGQL